MIRRLAAANAAWRTILQGIVVTALVAGWVAARAAVTGSGSVPWLHVGMVAAQAASMAAAAWIGRMVIEHRIIPVPVALDAWVRAARTLVAGLLITVVDAIWQAIAAAAGNGTLNVNNLAQTVAVAAGMAVVALLHRLLVDGLPIPSAGPPDPDPGEDTPAATQPLGPGARATGNIVDLGNGDRP